MLKIEKRFTSYYLFESKVYFYPIILVILIKNSNPSQGQCLLKIGCGGCPLGEHSSTIFKNCLPKSVFTLWSNGKLDHVMFLFLDLFVLSFLLFG